MASTTSTANPEDKKKKKPEHAAHVNGGAHHVKKPTPSSVKAVDIMVYGQRDTVITAKRQLNLSFMDEFPRHGDFIEKGALYTVCPRA